MYKRMRSIIISVLLLLALAPVQELAADGELTLQSIRDAKPGNPVTISGSAGIGPITIQVLRPTGTLLDVDTVIPHHGSYSYMFTLPPDSPLGMYTVVAGRGGNRISRMFEVAFEDEPVDEDDPIDTGDSGDSGGGGDSEGAEHREAIELHPPSHESVQVVYDWLEQELELLLRDLEHAPDPERADLLQEQAEKAGMYVEQAIRNHNRLNITQLLTVEQDAAHLNWEGISLSEPFKLFKEFAGQWKEKLSLFGEHVAPSRVVATLDLGDVEAAIVYFAIPEPIASEAREAGIDGLAVQVNGVNLTIDVEQLERGATLVIATADPSEAGLVTDMTLASEVYRFELWVEGQEKREFQRPIEVRMKVSPAVAVDEQLLVLAKLADGELQLFGGQYDAGEQVLATKLHAFSRYVILVNRVEFHDIQTVEAWAGRAIEVLAAKGIVTGKGGGVYDPDAAVTRAEFAAMLVRAFRINTLNNGDYPFLDVADETWYGQYASAAYREGLIDLQAAGGFEPGRELTRAEMAVMAAKAAQSEKRWNPVRNEEEPLNRFADTGSLSSDLRTELALVIRREIMIGEGEATFNPDGIATRAQAALVIYRLLSGNE